MGGALLASPVFVSGRGGPSNGSAHAAQPQRGSGHVAQLELVRSYTVTPPTVLAVKFCSTQEVIWLEEESLPPPPPMPPPRPSLLAMKYVMSPAATYALNCASVGESSLPLQPPIAITAVLVDRM